MREIKFRAWDEGNKVMHHNFQFITSGNEGDDWILFTSDEAPYEKDRKEGVVLNNPYFRQQLKIMQFTGLHDKNGKEIWEGDIIRILEDTYWLYIPDICEVEWDECGGWYPFADNYDAMIYPYGHNVEVIGNVHENAELLK